MDMNLQKKAVLIVAVILFLAVGINTAVLMFNDYSRYKDAILSKSEAIGEAMQRELLKVISLGVPIDSLEGVNEKLRDMVASDQSLGYGAVTDGAGKVLYHNTAAQIGKKMAALASPQTAEKNKVQVTTAGEFYDLAFPLPDSEGKLVGSLHVGVRSSVINSQLYQLLVWAVMVSAVCFILSVGLVYFFIARFITTPILSMERAAEKISRGDITSSIAVRGKDEIASLGRAINQMAVNLKEMISKIGAMTNSVSQVTLDLQTSSQNILAAADVQKSAVDETTSAMAQMDNSVSRIAKGAESLSASAGDTSTSIIELSTSIERIADNANVFSETAHDTASSIEEMVSTIKQIAASIDNLQSSSEAMASSIDEVNATTKDIEQRAVESVSLAEQVMINASDKGMQASAAAMTGIENIKKSVEALSDVINMLAKKTVDIGKILNVIDDVADQTNLLALNAAILASKAGEHGKGFTIVADEIKSLAERTSASTNEIAALINSVQEVTKSSIRMASEGIQTVDKGLLLVRDVNTALGDIVDSSKASTEMARAIQRATSEESIVIRKITESIEGMAEQTETISRAIQEQNRGSRLIIEATEKVKDLARQVKTATNEQKDGSRLIADVIENVTQQAVQIAGATSQQKEKSVEIVRSMGKMKDTTARLYDFSNQMNEVINSLKDQATILLDELRKFKV